MPEPPKQLKGFSRVTLKPGETQHVTVTLDPRAFALLRYGGEEVGDHAGRVRRAGRRFVGRHCAQELGLGFGGRRGGFAVDSLRGAPPIFVDKPFVLFGLSCLVICKIVILIGLLAESSQQRTYGHYWPAFPRFDAKTLPPQLKPHWTALLDWHD